MSFRLGLTGSIGMGKTTTAKMFADAGCAIWDADAAVHRLYAPGGPAAAPIGAVFAQAVCNGEVSREVLKQIIAGQPSALRIIERIVHPLVAADREKFIESSDADILVFDIPLLFETGGDATMDAVVCVSAPEEMQERRVLRRWNMTGPQLRQIKDNQMPDAEKRARADYVIVTDTLDHARKQVHDIVRNIKTRLAHA